MKVNDEKTFAIGNIQLRKVYKWIMESEKEVTPLFSVISSPISSHEISSNFLATHNIRLITEGRFPRME